jgi:hypothetical protein
MALLQEQAPKLQVLELEALVLGQASQDHLRVLERLVVWVLSTLQEPPSAQLALVLRPVQLAQKHWEAYARPVEPLEMVLQVLLRLVALAEKLGLEMVLYWVEEHSQASGLAPGRLSYLAALEEEVEVVAPDFELKPGMGWVVWVLVSRSCSGWGRWLLRLGVREVEASSHSEARTG